MDYEGLTSRWGTPLYVYSKPILEAAAREWKSAFPGLVCYAVKANSNLSILRIFAEAGLGADVVSVGELERALKAGFAPERIVFSGVGKTAAELTRAIEVGIASIQIETLDEIRLLAAIGKPARVSLRVNPEIDAKTDPYIATALPQSKFGFPEKSLGEALIAARAAGLHLVGLSCHLGSQIQSLDPYREAARRLVAIAKRLPEKLDFIDVGGGLGVGYRGETPPSVAELARELHAIVQGPRLFVEPGRRLVAESGVLLARVLGVKRSPAKNFIIVDAGMNDLLRPSLYEAYHPVASHPARGGAEEVFDVVGPVCESGDFLALDRKLAPPKVGDIVVISYAGAYGFSMASNYNSRPRPAEILLDGANERVIRKRETLESLWEEEVGIKM